MKFNCRERDDESTAVTRQELERLKKCAHIHQKVCTLFFTASELRRSPTAPCTMASGEEEALAGTPDEGGGRDDDEGSCRSEEEEEDDDDDDDDDDDEEEEEEEEEDAVPQTSGRDGLSFGDGTGEGAAVGPSGEGAGVRRAYPDRYRETLDKLRAAVEAAEASGGWREANVKKSSSQKPSEKSAGGFRGAFKKRANSYGAAIYVRCLQRSCSLGIFPTAELAARMYDAAAAILFGDGAVFNFPEDAGRKPPTPEEVAKAKLEINTGGKTCECNECGQVLPVKTRVCPRCSSAVHPDSKYVGVVKKGKANTFQAKFCKNGLVEYVGTFHTEEEAALAYDKRAREVYGDDEDHKFNFATLEEGEEAVGASLAALQEAGVVLRTIHHRKSKKRVVYGAQPEEEELEFRKKKKKRKKKTNNKKEKEEGKGKRGGSGAGGTKQRSGGGTTVGGGGDEMFNPFTSRSSDLGVPHPQSTTSVTDNLFGSFF